jgi:hypothetical protein
LRFSSRRYSNRSRCPYAPQQRSAETTLRNLMGQQTGKEWFSTDEVAAALGKAPFTVRE